MGTHRLIMFTLNICGDFFCKFQLGGDGRIAQFFSPPTPMAALLNFRHPLHLKHFDNFEFFYIKLYTPTTHHRVNGEYFDDDVHT